MVAEARGTWREPQENCTSRYFFTGTFGGKGTVFGEGTYENEGTYIPKGTFRLIVWRDKMGVPSQCTIVRTVG
jgi:hypothetical protein